MYDLEFGEIASNITSYNHLMENLRPTPIYFYPFLERVLTEQFNKVKPQYPMTIKIPKPLPYLLKGDLEPAQIIEIPEPLTIGSGVPIWFEDTSKQAYLRFGYRNMDARYIGDDKFDMEYIHGFLGGSSGHGKSVTLNAMIGALCYEYAPWELELHLSDAKIIEFKKYGVNHCIPQIATIAATEDADFVISVLENAFNEMNMRAKVFGNLGVSNLKSFRAKTGLTMPRVVIIMDEVESTFKNAGKQASKIAFYIDGFTRLGRAAGYHLFMATQNMSSDIPSSAIGQIRIRGCLGANQKTSESVLGNNGAQENFGRIGRLIINTEVMNGGDTYKSNVKYQTPFLTDDNFEHEMEELEQFGKRVGYAHHMSFYDENDLKLLGQFEEIQDKSYNRMKQSGELKDASKVILGYPAYVTDDIDGLLKVTLDGKDIENICILSTVSDRMNVLLNVISHSLSKDYKMLHYATTIEQTEFVRGTVGNYEVREASKPPFSTIGGIIQRRLYLLQLDAIAKDFNPNMEIVKSKFKDLKLEMYLSNSLMCRRYAAYLYMAKKGSPYTDVWDSVAGMFDSFIDIVNEFKKYGAVVNPIKKSDFFKVAIFVGDLSKIIGIGRDTKSKEVTMFKKLLQDASRVGVIFIVYSRSMEGLNDLTSGLRYVIFDSPDTKDWARMRTEPPASLSSKLAVLFDNTDSEKPQRKFKRTLLKEEY